MSLDANARTIKLLIETLEANHKLLSRLFDQANQEDEGRILQQLDLNHKTFRLVKGV